MDQVHFLENQTECWLAKTADLMIIAKTPAKTEKKKLAGSNFAG